MNSRPIYQHEYDNARRLQIEMQESALAANKAMIEMNNRHRNYLNQHPKIEVRREVETQYHVIEVPTPVENDNWEDKFNLELAQREIKNLKEEIKDEAADVIRLRGLLENAYQLISKWQEHTRYYEEQALYYRSEFQRLGGVKPAPVPQTITRARKPVLEAPMASQGHSNEDTSYVYRWIIKKSIEMNRGAAQKAMYIPTSTEIEKMKFMEQHELYRMNEYEVPSEYDHRINLQIWDNM